MPFPIASRSSLAAKASAWNDVVGEFFLAPRDAVQDVVLDELGEPSSASSRLDPVIAPVEAFKGAIDRPFGALDLRKRP